MRSAHQPDKRKFRRIDMDRFADMSPGEILGHYQVADLLPHDWIRPEDLSAELELLRLPREWGYWLSQFKWDYFASLTFAKEPTVPNARRQFSRWIRRLEQRAGCGVYWFAAIEVGVNERVHIHAIVGSAFRLFPSELEDAWRSWGLADVSRFHREEGADYYVTKFVALPNAYYDVSAYPWKEL